MACLDENAIVDLLGGRLSRNRVREFDSHFCQCDECRALLFELKHADPTEERTTLTSSVWLAALGLEETEHALARAPGLSQGTRVAGRYVLDRPIGAGGMGVVWAARDERSGDQVALKFLKAVSKERAARMIREARIATSLEHPGIVKVLDVMTAESFGGFGSSPVIAMELLEGQSLAQRLRRGRMSLAEVVEVFAPVLDAVSSVHAAGVVHRDLKPENVFLAEGPPPSVKVLDFGLAKRTRADSRAASSVSDLTHTGAMIGTPHYMAPEQIFGERSVDARADVWALGVMLFECLAGQRPITGENFGQVIKSITVSQVPPLSSLVDVPRDLSDTIASMLSRDPDARPSLPRVSEVLEWSGRYPHATRKRRWGAKTIAAVLALLVGAIGWVGYRFSAQPRSEAANPVESVARKPRTGPTTPESHAVDPDPASRPAKPAPAAPASSVSTSPHKSAGPGRRVVAPSALSAASAAPPQPSSSSKLPGGVEKQSPY